jgi:hypothetical protein
VRTPSWLSASRRAPRRRWKNGRLRNSTSEDEPAEIQTWLDPNSAALFDQRCRFEGLTRAAGIRRAIRAWSDRVLIIGHVPRAIVPHPRHGVKVRASCGSVEFSRLALAGRVAGLESVAAAARVAIFEWCAGAWPAASAFPPR